MDYKYIEQLLERYWQCQTSLEEEAILKTFFSQAEVPAELQPYQALFVGEKMLQDAVLPHDFDARVLSAIEEHETVKARKITLGRRMMPFYKAAASVAIILTLGNTAQKSFYGQEDGGDYHYENYQESYNDPAMAYDQVAGALQMVSQGLSETMTEDSLGLEDTVEIQNRQE